MSTSQGNPGVRFTLKKRSIRISSTDVNISSYNSDFLSGLFADVAKISVLSETGDCTKRGTEHMSGDASVESSCMVFESAKKKRCTSLGRTLSKARCSFMNLSDLQSIQSPRAVNEMVGSSSATVKQAPLLTDLSDSMRSYVGNTDAEERTRLEDCSHHDSLAFQLGCVSGLDGSTASTDDAAIIAFPNLPATVSDSSCSAGLTRANLIKQESSPEKQPRESFGWFVDLDDHRTDVTRVGMPYAVSSDDLAFQAPTAPKGANNDAEVEWAKAADTVDDVLGDFF